MMHDTDHMEWLRKAVELADGNNLALDGGPFGAVVVKDGELIAAVRNTVVKDTDPTAHAEINAIREAARRLGTYNLSGCTIYSSCEPCPMCLAAIWWSRLDACYYAATRDDAAAAHFDDRVFYNELQKPAPEHKVPLIHIKMKEGAQPFKNWITLKHDIRY